MKIIVFGATGFIGKHLIPYLKKQDHQIVIFSRYPEKAKEIFPELQHFHRWDGFSEEIISDCAKDADAIINLSGENIAAKPWTKRQRFRILQSRSQLGTTIASALSKIRNKPDVYIQASAIGFYGPQPGETCTEGCTVGSGFLAQVTEAWEAPANEIRQLGVRVPIIRTGVVLEKEGGLIQKMMIPMRFFVGGYPGNGKQYLSWIHMEDEIRAIDFLLHNKKTDGAYNLTAPNPVRMRFFSKLLGKATGKPVWIPVPKWAIKLTVGQMGEEILLADQKVIPEKLEKEGFQFEYPSLEKAMNEIF